MSQSTVIAMVVFGAFIIYATMKGSLSTYISLLFGPTTPASVTPSNSGSTALGGLSIVPGGLTNKAFDLLGIPQATDNTALANVFSQPLAPGLSTWQIG